VLYFTCSGTSDPALYETSFPERGYPTTEKARIMRAFSVALEYVAILRTLRSRVLLLRPDATSGCGDDFYADTRGKVRMVEMLKRTGG
jgi:hypothetical protein